MEVTREELKRMYDELSIAQMQEKLGGIAVSAVYRLLDQAGIERKLKRSKVTLAD